MFTKARGFLLWLFGWEDPVRTPEQEIDAKAQELTVNLNRCKVHVAKLIKEQRDLQEKIHRNTNQVTYHLREARNCMSRNEEERAREHLRQKKKCEGHGERYKSELEKFKSESEKLVDYVKKLEFNLEQLKRHKMLLLTRKQVYEAEQLLIGSGGADDEAGVKDLLAGLEDEVVEKEQRVLLEHELAPSGGLGEGRDPELLEATASADIEEELSLLKKQIGPGRPPEIAPRDDIVVAEDEEKPEQSTSKDDIIFIK